jgi:uncharacterized membrane protein
MSFYLLAKRQSLILLILCMYVCTYVCMYVRTYVYVCLIMRLANQTGQHVFSRRGQ